ncbi:hypothetical protein BH11ACT8_BH11ACT8_31860 [soil metagenome]
MDVPLTLSSPDDWAGVTCRPSSGTGTLARLGSVTLLVGSTDPQEVAPLLGQAEMVATNGAQGRQLVRGFALLLGTSPEDPPAFAAFAPHSTGLAVLVSGDATVTVNGETLSGADSLAWVERLVPWPITELSAVVDTAAVAQPHLRLGEGVISAGGLSLGTGLAAVPAEEMIAAAPPATPDVAVMTEEMPLEVPADVPAEAPAEAPAGVPAEAPAEETPQEAPAVEAEQPPPPPPPPAPVEPPVADFDSVLLGDLEDDEHEHDPLPIVVDERDVAEHGSHVEEVRGVYCKNRHFNDPRQLFCAICGINMVQQTPVLVNGTRPPLGVIVLDDGAVFQVDSAYLLGRDPDSDERVQAGSVRGVPIQDTSNQISRVHARLELRGWDVVLVDNASTNGTFVNPPQTTGWQRLPSGGEHLLVQGTRVRIGHRTLAFNTHAGG